MAEIPVIIKMMNGELLQVNIDPTKENDEIVADLQRVLSDEMDTSAIKLIRTAPGTSPSNFARPRLESEELILAISDPKGWIPWSFEDKSDFMRIIVQRDWKALVDWMDHHPNPNLVYTNAEGPFTPLQILISAVSRGISHPIDPINPILRMLDMGVKHRLPDGETVLQWMGGNGMAATIMRLDQADGKERLKRFLDGLSFYYPDLIRETHADINRQLLDPFSIPRNGRAQKIEHYPEFMKYLSQYMRTHSFGRRVKKSGKKSRKAVKKSRKKSGKKPGKKSGKKPGKKSGKAVKKSGKAVKKSGKKSGKRLKKVVKK